MAYSRQITFFIILFKILLKACSFGFMYNVSTLAQVPGLTWTNADTDPGRHMASLDHAEFSSGPYKTQA